MSLNERRYSSRARRRKGSEKPTDREKFSLSQNYQRQEVDFGHLIRKWGPLVAVAAVGYALLDAFVF